MQLTNRKSGGKVGRGFSLVELVIVIVIIGIIAAIAIPRVSRGSKGAGESSLSSNLAVVRNAVEMYATEHGGTFPGVVADGLGGAANSTAAMNSQLTVYSKSDGTCKGTRDAANGFVFGPYLRKGMPPLPVGANKGKTTVKLDITASPPPASVGTGEGWVYNQTTGDVIANANDPDDSGAKTYDQY